MALLTPHQKKALNYKRHISLTANAGSGKTFVLSKRFLEIAVNENVELRNIAAITFTDKAASELYKKIADQIEAKLSENPPGQAAWKLKKLRRELLSANISTIHSFCINILKEFPVEAGIDANFIPIDEKLSDELIELSVEEVIKEAFRRNDKNLEELKYLIRIFASKGIFSKQLASLIKSRKNVLKIKEKIYEEKDEQEIAQFFKDKFEAKLSEIFSNEIPALIQNLEAINNAVLYEDSQNHLAGIVSDNLSVIQAEIFPVKVIPSLKIICEALLTSGGSIRKQNYLTGQLRESCIRECSNAEKFFRQFKFLFEIPENKNSERELARFGKSLLNIFDKTLFRYEQKKKESGYLDFEDILLSARIILKNPAVQEELSKKFKFLMVDEYQDTNEIQYEIFLPILDDLRKGNLFVVGDEKQSIYMFRDAELEVFNQTKKGIKESAGEEFLLTLPDSFRMDPQLCAFTNYLFKNLFDSPNAVYNEVENTEIICAKDFNFPGKAEILLAQQPEDEENERDFLEAELTAKRILQLTRDEQKKIELKDIAILCRKRRSFTDLEVVFARYKIPYSIVGGKGFYQRQSVFDIYNYFSFLLDNDNSASLVGILRSPFFNISDAEIFEISLQFGKSFWQKLKSYSQKNENIAETAAMLQENIQLANNIDITSLLRKILRETGYLAVLSAKQNGSQELANIDKLIKVTIEYASKDFKTFYDYINFLKDSISEIEDEAQAALTDDSDSVKIMTLHQSKGLEFPAVFLFKSHETSQKDKSKAKSVTVNKEFGLLSKLPPEGKYFEKYSPAPVVELSDFIADKKNLAEIKRLFYVGITRAKNYIFISALKGKKNSYNKDSFIGLLGEGLNSDFTSDEIRFSTSLKFLKEKDGSYFNFEEPVEVCVPVIKEIEEQPSLEDEQPADEKNIEANLSFIEDYSKGEIISATKVAVYKQCPLKYKLTYVLGASPIIALSKKYSTDYEFNPVEDADEAVEEEPVKKSFPEVKGRIIHSILQKEISPGEADNFISSSINNELDYINLSEENSKNLKEEITADLNKFYRSSSYQWLKKFSSYKNEFEIYIKEADYYLYGIIDRLILEGGKAVIVDYKTDAVDKNDIAQRAESYFNQLSFYAYVVQKLYPQLKEFELKIIFLKHPDENIEKKISYDDLNLLRLEINQMVSNIRAGIFTKNLNHCKRCFFSEKLYNCIIK